MPGLNSAIYQIGNWTNLKPEVPGMLKDYAKAAIRTDPRDLLQWQVITYSKYIFLDLYISIYKDIRYIAYFEHSSSTYPNLCVVVASINDDDKYNSHRTLKVACGLQRSFEAPICISSMMYLFVCYLSHLFLLDSL